MVFSLLMGKYLEGLLSIAGPHTYSVNIAGDYLTIQDETGVYTFQKVK
jgi:hypothetical protein